MSLLKRSCSPGVSSAAGGADSVVDASDWRMSVGAKGRFLLVAAVNERARFALRGTRCNNPNMLASCETLAHFLNCGFVLPDFCSRKFLAGRLVAISGRLETAAGRTQH